MKRRCCQLALGLIMTSLAGCGLKGPLYFPSDEKSRQQTPVQQTQPAAAPQNTSSAAQQEPSTDGQYHSASSVQTEQRTDSHTDSQANP